MVFKNIFRIKASLPEVIHIVMFYNNGIIFQTTFEQDINIPKLGETLARIIGKARKINEICNFKQTDYRKLIIEMEEVTIIIIKLGEDSNIALVFKNEDSKQINLTPIKRYLSRIEELIDMDKSELIVKQILAKEDTTKALESLLKKKSEELESIKGKLNDPSNESEKEKLTKECDLLEQEWKKLKDEEEKIQNELKNLKSEIEKQQKK